MDYVQEHVRVIHENPGTSVTNSNDLMLLEFDLASPLTFAMFLPCLSPIGCFPMIAIRKSWYCTIVSYLRLFIIE